MQENKEYKINITKQEIYLYLYVKASSSFSSWGGSYQSRQEVKITAKPIKGKANKDLLSFISESLSIPLRHIHLSHGETSKFKTVVFPLEQTILEKLQTI